MDIELYIGRFSFFNTFICKDHDYIEEYSLYYMGHMNSIKTKTTMIATIVAILSMTMGFAPIAYAGSSTMALNVLPICTVLFPASTPELDDDADTFTVGITPGVAVVATTTINVANTDQGTQPILVNVNGGFGDPTTHIEPPQITVTAAPAGSSVSTGANVMAEGTDFLIVSLIGQDTTDITFDVDMDPVNFVNQPVSGFQSATAQFTLDPCV